MKSFRTILVILILAATSLAANDSSDVRLLPFSSVQMDDQVWRPRIRKLVSDTLPHAFRQTGGAQNRLRQCAEWQESGGKTSLPRKHRFNTSDLYKVMEGAALMIKAEPNPEIEAKMDRIIKIIARAQREDGYLYINHITGNPNVHEMGNRPYSHVLHSHELYNMGHLYEAAVAYALATGKTSLLNVAEKHAQHVNKAFFEGDPNYNDGKPVNQAPGHQEIEIGLVKLHLYTGKELYLDMAKKFLDIRGVTFKTTGRGINSPTYAQQHAPVAEQRKAVGHAVRATYQYAAMAEVDSLLGTSDYTEALDSIWHNIVDTKMHITGGVGAVHGIEGFGPSYKLPNKHTYLETCAAVGNVFFNMRMFLKYRDARYVDVAEVALLNNCLSGIGLDGKSFFYPNPLEADEGHGPRSGWFGCACCPANMARLIPQVSGYMYAHTSDQVFCLLYGQNKGNIKLGKTEVELVQKTDYPFGGEVELTVNPERKSSFTLSLRIPTWTGKQIVPGKLYSYIGEPGTWSVTVNGKTETAAVENGFLHIRRKWRTGDTVTLNLPMPVRINKAIERVRDNINRIAISRGPLVYCAEGIDNGGKVQRFSLEHDKILSKAKIKAIEGETPLAGLPGIELPALEKTASVEDRDSSLKMIPYFAWSNRDRSSMITWIGTSSNIASADSTKATDLKYKSVKASHTFQNDTVTALRMRNEPVSSSDDSIPRWTSWPQKGRAQWCEIDLGEVQDVKSVSVYFYDDAGGVKVPAKWHFEALLDGKWKLVDIYNTDSLSTLKDNYNLVHPASTLKTDRIRIVTRPQADACVGILSLDIEFRKK